MKLDTENDNETKKIKFQVENFLINYKERNWEMNELYMTFNQMAKILIVS